MNHPHRQFFWTGRSRPLSVTRLLVIFLVLYVIVPSISIEHQATAQSSGELTFLDAIKRNQTGNALALDGPRNIDISPDGKHLYSVSAGGSSTAGAIGVFGINPSTGALTFIEEQKNPDPPYLVATSWPYREVKNYRNLSVIRISPNGKFVYAGSQKDQAIYTFSRDQSTGKLTYLGFDIPKPPGYGGAQNIVNLTFVSDGSQMYVTGGQRLTLVNVNTTTGALTDVVGYQHSSTNGLPRCYHDVQLGLDETKLYTTDCLSPLSIDVWDRDPSSGLLTHVQEMSDVAGEPKYLAMSPDGKFMYMGNQFGNHISILSIDQTTGFLTLLEEPSGHNGRVLIMSPDGNHLLAVDGNRNLRSWSRDASSGSVAFVDVETNGVNGVFGMDRPNAVVTTPDGQFVYVASYRSDAIAYFSFSGGGGSSPDSDGDGITEHDDKSVEHCQ